MTLEDKGEEIMRQKRGNKIIYLFFVMNFYS